MDPKQSEESPPCPGCGATSAAALTQTLEYQAQDPQKTGQPISVLVVYKCRCGRAFTVREQFCPPTKTNPADS